LPDSIQIDELLPNELYMMVNAEQTFEKDIYKVSILEELVIYREEGSEHVMSWKSSSKII
jgi:hypothetical protein